MALSAGILTAMEQSPVATAMNAVAESARFLREAEIRTAHHEYSPALEAAETAAALTPESIKVRIALAHQLLLCANHLGGPGLESACGGGVKQTFREIKKSYLAIGGDLEQAYHLANRGLAMAINLERNRGSEVYASGKQSEDI